MTLFVKGNMQKTRRPGVKGGGRNKKEKKQVKTCDDKYEILILSVVCDPLKNRPSSLGSEEGGEGENHWYDGTENEKYVGISCMVVHLSALCCSVRPPPRPSLAGKSHLLTPRLF